MQRLIDWCEASGVTFEFTGSLDPKHPGCYSDPRRHIEVLDGMDPVKTLSAFAHEAGHAALCHVPSLFDHVTARQERAADEWAAHFLIDPTEYRLAEAKYGTRVDWIAQELGVLKRLVVAFEHTLDRIGNTVYVNPRMGARQYTARIPA